MDFAIFLEAHESGPLIETEAVVDLLLLELSLVQETTIFLQEALVEVLLEVTQRVRQTVADHA